MSRGSIMDYTEAVRGRYLRAGNKEKSRILDQFVLVTGRVKPGFEMAPVEGKCPEMGQNKG